MRAAVFHGNKVITIERVPDLAPARDGLVVKVARCGICGTDVALTSGSAFDYKAGTRLGHEIAGEVVAVGTEVTDVRVGDRIASLPSTGCGVCEACRDDRPMLCRSKLSHGGFAEFIAPKARSVVVLPRNLSLADGALVEPMACGLHALRQCQFRGGERVLIIGAGTMALSLVFWARRLGAARVVVVSRSMRNQEHVLAFGADAAHTLDEDDSALAHSLGGSPDIVAECVGKPSLLNLAIDHVRIGGWVVSMGMCAHGEPLVPARCSLKEIKLAFPLGYSLDEFVETARELDSAHIDAARIVSDVISLHELPEIIDELRAGRKAIKIQVDPNLEEGHG